MEGENDHPIICCICLKPCKHARELPCCKSSACKSCLKAWISTNDRCPKCKTIIRKTKHLCKMHHKSLDYFCQTCNQYLCSDCLFEQVQSSNGPHSNHKIVKASDITNATKADLEEYLKSLQNYSDALKNLIIDIDKLKLTIIPMEFNTIAESKSTFELLKHEVELAYEDKSKDYLNISNSIEQKITKLQSLLEEAELFLTNDDPKMVPAALKSIENLKQISEEFTPIESKPPNLEFQNKLSPPLESFQVRIENFENILLKVINSETENDFVYSEEKTFFGCVWRAKIYPNGTQSGKGTHLSTYVELLSGNHVPASFVYQVEIIAKRNGAKNILRQYSSVFKPMDSWGWNKIVSLESLLKNYLDDDGSLQLIFSLGPNSYAFLASAKQDEYNSVWKEWKHLKNEAEKLKKRLNTQLNESDDNSQITKSEF